MKKLIIVASLILAIKTATAQERPTISNMPSEVITAFDHDDTTQLKKAIGKMDINDCFGEYSLLSQSIRSNAKNCFGLLIKLGAQVNKSCNGYVTPLMHASKYGHLDMVKILVQKGADVNYKYNGDFAPANGQTPISYARKYHHEDIAQYLESIKK